MGLDQYAFVEKKCGKEVEIQYWRKHANLEGYMSRLWESRGNSGTFNCEKLYLSSSDLETLRDIHADLEETSGFFWGQTTQSKIDATSKFIDDALKYLEEGHKVYYTSWW